MEHVARLVEKTVQSRKREASALINTHMGSAGAKTMQKKTYYVLLLIHTINLQNTDVQIECSVPKYLLVKDISPIMEPNKICLKPSYRVSVHFVLNTILVILYGIFFGQQSVRKYLDKGVIITKQKDTSSSVISPSDNRYCVFP